MIGKSLSIAGWLGYGEDSFEGGGNPRLEHMLTPNFLMVLLVSAMRGPQ